MCIKENAVSPQVLIIVNPGKEARIARDVLDALYTYDERLCVKSAKGLLAVFSRLEADEVINLLKKYPIRGVLSVNRIDGYAPISGSIEDALTSILEELAEKMGGRINIEIRSRGYFKTEKLRSIIENIANRIGLKKRGGQTVRIELTDKFVYYYFRRRAH